MAGKLGTNQLNGDETLKFVIARLVDGTHAALSEQSENFEAFGEEKSWFELPFCGGFAGRPRRDSHGPRLSSAHRATHGSTQGFAVRRHRHVRQRQRRTALRAVVRAGRVIGLT